MYGRKVGSEDYGMGGDVMRQAGRDSMPIASQFFPTIDGLSDKDSPAYTGTWKQVTPQSGGTQSLFGGTPVQIDYNLSKQYGKCTDFFLFFPSITATNSNASAQSVVLPPTPYWVQSVEYLFGGDTKETVYPATLFAEAATFQTDQEFDQTYGQLSISAGSSVVNNAAGAYLAVYNTVTVAGSGSGTTLLQGPNNNGFFLPLTGLLPSMQPFLAGIDTEVKIRVNFASSISPSIGWATANAAQTAVLEFANGSTIRNSQATSTVSYSNGSATPVLWVKEASLPKKTHQQLMRLHQTGVVYNCLRRVTWKGVSQSLTAAITSERDDQLQSFYGNSAALYFYLAPESNAIEDCLYRLPVSTAHVKDSSKNGVTPEMPASLIENYISTSTTPVSSYFINSATFTTYLFPFTSSLIRSNYGKRLGGMDLGGQEYISYKKPAATYHGALASTPTMAANVISFDYVKLTVKGGNVTLDREGQTE